ncbi:hypothetical protein [Thermodesulfovibrio hydrogeniphilus]
MKEKISYFQMIVAILGFLSLFCCIIYSWKKGLYYEIEEKCTIKQKFGKCLIPLRTAFFLLGMFYNSYSR